MPPCLHAFNLHSPSALGLAGDLVGCLSGAPADLSSNPAHLANFGRVSLTPFSNVNFAGYRPWVALLCRDDDKYHDWAKQQCANHPSRLLATNE